MIKVTQTLEKEKKVQLPFTLFSEKKNEGDPAIPIYPLFLLQAQALFLKTF